MKVILEEHQRYYPFNIQRKIWKDCMASLDSTAPYFKLSFLFFLKCLLYSDMILMPILFNTHIIL